MIERATKHKSYYGRVNLRNKVNFILYNICGPDACCMYCIYGCLCPHLDFVSSRLLWIDSRLATLNAYMLTSSRREILHTFLEYPRHPAGLAVFEVCAS